MMAKCIAPVWCIWIRAHYTNQVKSLTGVEVDFFLFAFSAGMSLHALRFGLGLLEIASLGLPNEINRPSDFENKITPGR